MSNVLQALMGVLATVQSRPAATTLNPSDKGAGITLSGGNLTAAGVSTNNVRSTTSKTTGKLYFEVTVNSGATGNALGVALANAGMSLTATGPGLDGGNGSICWYDTSPWYLNGGSVGNAEIMNNGDV